MSQEFIIYLGREAVYTILLLAGPLLGASLLIGLLVSIFQATTQIQEQTLTFVPKIVVVFLSLIIFGPWMLNLLIAFTSNLFAVIPRLMY
ncbi:MAG: EscS/YscS/HrcS family type secretion system export apparatus protein [Peptococcaceae bacterium]|jgi:flagellar biosynthetic protein FliQ|uniref:Flagellar biosynthetic protein FliQ n=1 Tax=Thermanaerosceptrum fracticalcis TaxID=1712410 RepID=A0A7G6E101_THEFR|nr:flagellar biosynthesis protein FliQ [Thermanaerosceptrum fracticalcis]MBZ4653526.1 EscS/YscS/HrcS family type secretion system export apparatus protein [Peptococcaceae bacterium]QNB45755.1 flagellar biosynthesis protein FliQ [Thermanaerosceptrum fracticalcis]